MSSREERLRQLEDAVTAPRTQRAMRELAEWLDGGDMPTGAKSEPTDRKREPATKSRRPPYGPWDIRAARQALREAGQSETQEAVIDLLGWDRKTVHKYWAESEPSRE